VSIWNVSTRVFAALVVAPGHESKGVSTRREYHAQARRVSSASTKRPWGLPRHGAITARAPPPRPRHTLLPVSPRCCSPSARAHPTPHEQSLHWPLMRLCSQMLAPPQSLHWLLWRLCSHFLRPLVQGEGCGAARADGRRQRQRVAAASSRAHARSGGPWGRATPHLGTSLGTPVNNETPTVGVRPPPAPG